MPVFHIVQRLKGRNTVLRQEIKQLREELCALGDLYLNTPSGEVDFTSRNPSDHVRYEEFKKRYGSLELVNVRSEPTWTTAYGETLPVSQMDDQHLRNTISWLQRRLTAMFGTVRYLSSTQRLVQSLSDMLKEAERRGISV